MNKPGFFDEYPSFFHTSATAAFPNRLNERYRACIEWNRPIISGKRVVDIASHDGRWSFAAIKAGASHVVGLEARDHLVKAAQSNLREYGVSENSFRFVLGDAFETIDRIEPRSVDTVLCLGFFYHVANHVLLLSKIARLKPQHIILDTAVAADHRSVVVFQKENPELESKAVRFDGNVQETVLVGFPSLPAIELMMSNFGWRYEYYPWHGVGIRQWDHIEDYHDGTRVTLRARSAEA